MAERRCVLLKGLRLPGAKICLFDAPPQDPLKSEYKRGILDLCHKKKFPAPHYCKTLRGGGEIIAQIPFRVDGIFNNWDYKNGPPYVFPSPEEALSNMWERGGKLFSTVWPYHFELRFLGYIHEYSPYKFSCAWGWTNQGMMIPVGALNPAWLTDENINFSISFIAPVIADAPVWTRFECLGVSFAFNSGLHELAVIKNLFYNIGYKIYFKCVPVNFTWDDYLTLPNWGSTSSRGWTYVGLNAFSLVLVVRRGSKDFKVCWPVSVFKKPRYAAVVDGPSGLVVGPPLEIY
jgi:hypothetical protein